MAIRSMIRCCACHENLSEVLYGYEDTFRTIHALCECCYDSMKSNIDRMAASRAIEQQIDATDFDE